MNFRILMTKRKDKERNEDKNKKKNASEDERKKSWIKGNRQMVNNSERTIGETEG